MLFPGESTCAPGGWVGCANGFVPAASGWGCEPVLPAQPCSGATREALGETACKPIGDCAAGVPADVDLFVDATGPQDATHFRSLAAAVAAAGSGAKIFLAAGSYAEPLTLTRPVTLVGACPARVSIVGPGGVVASTIRVNTTGVVLERLTLRSGYVGLSIAGGGSVVARQVVIDGAGAAAVSLAEAGASVTLSDCAIRDAFPVSNGSGYGVTVQNGSTATLTDCALVGNHVTALRASGNGSTILAASVVVRGTKPSPQYDWGRAAVAQRAARLELRRAALLDAYETGVVVIDDSIGVLEDVVVSNTVPNAANLFGRAVNVADFSRLTLLRSTLSHNRDAALMLAGASAFGDVRNSVIVDTQGSADGVGRGITVQEGAFLALSESAVVNSAEVGIAVVDVDSFATLGRSAVLGTGPDARGQFGHGLLMGLSSLTAKGCHLAGNSAIGLALGPGAFLGEDLTITGNGTGLFADTRVSLKVSDTIPASAGADEAFLSSSSRFIGNTAPNGSGLLVLPPGLGR